MRKTILCSWLLLAFLFPWLCAAEQTQPPQQDPVSGSAPKYSATGGGASPGSLIGSSDNNLFTGSFIHSIPLEVPPGTQGLQPNIAFSYNSSSSNGWCGVGWDLSFGVIQRSSKNGIPHYDNNDTFIYCSQGAAQELTKVADNEYRIKIDSSFMKFVFDPDTNEWTVYDKGGNRYIFGRVVNGRDSKISKPGTALVYSWSLSNIIDINDNEIQFYYIQDQNQIYLDRIDYTLHLSEPVLLRQVFFNLEDRLDQNSNYRAGFGVVTAKRLASIETVVNGQRVKKYELKYALNQPSLLQALTTYGSNDGANWDKSLPPTTFEYYSHADALQDVVWRSESIDNTGEDADRIFVGDFNGDGRNDILITGTGAGDDEWRVYLSQGDSFILDNSLWLTKSIDNTGSDMDKIIPGDYNNDGKADIMFIDGHSEPHPWIVLQSDGTKFVDKGMWQARNISLDDKFSVGDFNSDGLTDVWVASVIVTNLDPPETPRPRIVKMLNMDVYINNGSAFNPAVSWYQNNYPTDSDVTQQRFYLADFNGDSKTDIMHLDPWTNQWFMLSSEGDKFSAPVLWLTLSVDWEGEDIDRIEIGDFNADGLADVLYIVSGTPFGWHVYLSAGNGFKTDNNLWLTLSTDPTGDDFDYILLGDYNADGKTDVLYANGHTREWKTFYSTGNTFILGNNLLTRGIDHTGDDEDTMLVADFSGDGMSDVAHIGEGSGNANWRILTEAGQVPNLLCRITNNLEGVTEINYVPSTRFVNADLGFPVQVIDTLTLYDHLPAVYGCHQVTKRYEYSGGKYDRRAKEFLGFSEVKSFDALGNYATTKFYQNYGAVTEEDNTAINPFKGKIYEQASYKADGTPLAKTEMTYDCTLPFPKVYFPRLNSAISTSYDITTKQTEVTYQYDEYGNVNQLENKGDISNTTDNVLSLTEYNYNTVKYIVSLPKIQETRDYNNETVAKSWFYYDNLGLGGVDKGQLTQKSQQLNGLETVVAKFEYDDYYGNLIKSFDAKNNAVTTAYDTLYHTFPVTVTNALGHTGTATYDPKTGNTLTETDANDQTTTYVYDEFGRVTKVFGPLDLDDSPGTLYFYGDHTQPRSVMVRTKEEEKTDTTPAKYISNYQFFDGLGRVAQTQIQASSYWQSPIISDCKEYDERGLMVKSYQPFFGDRFTHPEWTKGKYYSYVPGSYSTVYEYDALGRVSSQNNADGSINTVTIDGWKETRTDGNIHQQDYQKDTFGRVIEINEHNQGEIYTTKYTYDPLGNLIEIKNNMNEITSINYDTWGRKTSMDDPKMGHWSYEYDLNGNLVSQTDNNGDSHKITLTYDALNRITAKTYPDDTSINYSYDADTETPTANPYAKGRLIKVTDLSGYTKFFYDRLGRVTTTVKGIQEETGLNEYFTHSQYNAMGQQTKLTYPDGTEIDYQYNHAGDLITVNSGTLNYVKGICYNARQQMVNVDFGNDLSTFYEYIPQNARLYKLITGSTAGFIYTDPQLPANPGYPGDPGNPGWPGNPDNPDYPGGPPGYPGEPGGPGFTDPDPGDGISDSGLIFPDPTFVVPNRKDIKAFNELFNSSEEVSYEK